MKTRFYIIIAMAVLFSMYVLMHAPVYNDTKCMSGFQHSHFGQCVDSRFFEIPSAHAVHTGEGHHSIPQPEPTNDDGNLPTCDPNPAQDFGKCTKMYEEPDNRLQDVLDICACQESGQPCIQPEFRWWNTTHFIDNIDCEFLDKVDGSHTYGVPFDDNGITAGMVSFDSSGTRTEIPVENVCGPNALFVDGICTPNCGVDTEYVNGVCEIITIEPSHYVNTSPFYQAMLMFSLFLWPYFISGAAIFIVLVKTPRYNKSTRIAVTLAGSLVITWFLAMMFIGIWPQMGA